MVKKIEVIRIISMGGWMDPSGNGKQYGCDLTDLEQNKKKQQ